MDRQFSERQLIRWAVPGWITIFLVILIFGIHWISSDSFRSITTEDIEINTGVIVAIGGLIIAAGFALGFMLFQVYFAVYWCDRGIGKCRVSGILGKVVDYQDVIDHLDKYKAHYQSELNLPITSTTPSLRQNVETSIAALWWRCLNKSINNRTIWEDRNRYIVAVYHSLGTILIGTYGISLAYISLVIYGIACGNCITNCDIAPIIINIILLALWILVLLKTRKDTEYSHRQLMKNGLYFFFTEDTAE